MLWLSHLDWVDPAGRTEVFLWRKVGPARRSTLPSQKPSQLFLSSPRFVRKCMKSCIAQGSSSRRVTLLILPVQLFSMLAGRYFDFRFHTQESIISLQHQIPHRLLIRIFYFVGRKKNWKWFFFFAVSNYTREAGVRSLERKIGGVCRAVAVRVGTSFGRNFICHYFTCFVSSGKTGLRFQSTRTPILRG